MLDEYATYFTVADIDVIRPFDSYFRHSRKIAAEHSDDAHRDCLGDDELSRRLHTLRAQQYGHGDILAWSRLPGVAPLSAACSLGIGCHHSAMATSRRDGRQMAIGGEGFVKTDYLHRHQPTVRRRAPSGSTSILTRTVSSGRISSMRSGHSMRQSAPESR